LRIITQDENLIIKDEVYPAILTEQAQAETMPCPVASEKLGIDILDSLLQQIEEISFSEAESESEKIGRNGCIKL